MKSVSAVETRRGTKGVARADREAQIVAAGGRLFAARGFTAVAVEEVAAEVGITKPLIYSYFGSKEGLALACVRHAGETVAGEVERTAALGEVGLARALVTLDGLFAVLEPDPWMWRILGLPASGEVAALLTTYAARLRAMSLDGVAELLELGGDDDPTDVALLSEVWSSALDALVTWWLDHPDEPREQMTARCARVFDHVFGRAAS